MNNKLIYTFILGDYDSLKSPKVITKGWDYICITNNKNLVSDVWDIKYIETPGKNLKREAMSIMIKYFDYINEGYETIISIGGQILIRENLDDFTKQYGLDGDKYDIGFLIHPCRNCIYKEAGAILGINKDSVTNINNHVNELKKSGYPVNNGLYETGVIVRKTNSGVTKSFFKLWGEDYDSLPSKRDQMSCNYSIWRFKKNNELRIKEITQDTIYTKYFAIHKHK